MHEKKKALVEPPDFPRFRLMTRNGEVRPSFKGIGSHDDDHDMGTLQGCFARVIPTVKLKLHVPSTQHQGDTDMVQRKTPILWERDWWGTYRVS